MIEVTSIIMASFGDRTILTRHILLVVSSSTIVQVSPQVMENLIVLVSRPLPTIVRWVFILPSR